jgi:hypothetical protein
MAPFRLLEGVQVTNRFKEKKRGQKTRKRKPVIFVICEGEKTEITYFNKYRTRESLVEVKSMPSQHKSASALVEHAKDVIKNENYYPEDADQLWCVFDRDDNTDSDLQKAEQVANRKGYHIAFSNPSFELWFLLHFADQTGYIKDGEGVIKKLKTDGYISNYSKVGDYFELLRPLRGEALKRANALEKRHQKDGVKLLSRKSNPYTSVSHLIEELIGCVS